MLTPRKCGIMKPITAFSGGLTPTTSVACLGNLPFPTRKRRNSSPYFPTCIIGPPLFFLHEWTDAFQKTPTAKFVSLQKPIFRLREQAYAAYRLRVPRSSFSCLIRTSGVISASVKTLTVAALSLTLGLGLPTGAQVPANASPNTESRRTKNIVPEEMWKRVKQCVFPTYAALAFSAQITGTVDIGLGISPEGDVGNYRVLSGHPLLVAPAVDAIRQWKFQPNVVQVEVTWTRIRALVRFNADGTTSVDLAPGILADNFGDPGTPRSSASEFPRPATAPTCKSVQPWTGAQAKEIEASEVSSGSYKNNYFGLTFHFPSEWRVADRDALDSVDANMKDGGQTQ